MRSKRATPASKPTRSSSRPDPTRPHACLPGPTACARRSSRFVPALTRTPRNSLRVTSWLLAPGTRERNWPSKPREPVIACCCQGVMSGRFPRSSVSGTGGRSGFSQPGSSQSAPRSAERSGRRCARATAALWFVSAKKKSPRPAFNVSGASPDRTTANHSSRMEACSTSRASCGAAASARTSAGFICRSSLPTVTRFTSKAVSHHSQVCISSACRFSATCRPRRWSASGVTAHWSPAGPRSALRSRRRLSFLNVSARQFRLFGSRLEDRYRCGHQGRAGRRVSSTAQNLHGAGR